MSYTGTEGETSAVFRRDLDPLVLGATAATFVAPGSVTNGQFGLYRWDIPAHGGGGDPPHRRRAVRAGVGRLLRPARPGQPLT